MKVKDINSFQGNITKTMEEKFLFGDSSTLPENLGSEHAALASTSDFVQYAREAVWNNGIAQSVDYQVHLENKLKNLFTFDSRESLENILRFIKRENINVETLVTYKEEISRVLNKKTFKELKLFLHRDFESPESTELQLYIQIVFNHDVDAGSAFYKVIEEFLAHRKLSEDKLHVTYKNNGF